MNTRMFWWMAKRTVDMDIKYLIRPTGDRLEDKFEFLFKKYFVLIKHIFIKFRLGEDRVKIKNREIFYNSPVGFAGFQAVLCEHSYWVSQLEGISKKPLIIDAGANVGYFSLGMKRIFPKAEIHCFEPISLTFEALSKNLEGCENISLNQVALGANDGNVYMNSDEGQPSLSNISSNKDGEKVKVAKLDQYSQRKFPGRKIDLLKIDVEGYELKVIEGAIKTIGNCKYIHMEFNTENYNLSDLMDSLRPTGKRFQLLFIRNFSNDTDSHFEAGDLLLKVI